MMASSCGTFREARARGDGWHVAPNSSSPAPRAKTPPDAGGKVAASERRGGGARFGTQCCDSATHDQPSCAVPAIRQFRVDKRDRVDLTCPCNLAHAWSVALASQRERRPAWQAMTSAGWGAAYDFRCRVVAPPERWRSRLPAVSPRRPSPAASPINRPRPMLRPPRDPARPGHRSPSRASTTTMARWCR